MSVTQFMQQRRARLVGVKEAVEAMTELRPALQRKTMRIAMSAAGGVVLNDARSRVVRESGLLKKALGVKVSASKQKEWFAAVGAKRGNKLAIRVTKRGQVRTLSTKKASKLAESGTKLTYRNPTRYAHLVEKGTRSHTVATQKAGMTNGSQWFGKSARVRARAKPFLRPAADATAEIAGQTAVRKIKEGIEQEAAKLYARQRAKARI
jgi:HK97 gp10 family phage protein